MSKPRQLVTLALVALGITAFAADAQADEVSLQLGVVAQRYPWNGIVDVNYKTEGWPKSGEMFGAVEITADGQVYTNTLDIFATGKGKTGVAAHAVDLKWLFGGIRNNVQFKALVSDQPIGFADVKPLADGEFPAGKADKACMFRSMDIVNSADESQVSPYGSWSVDLYVSADREIAKDSISFAYLVSEDIWTSIKPTAKLEVGKEVAAIATWVKPVLSWAKLPPSWHYSCKTTRGLTCGVKNLSKANTGAKLKVVMRLTSNEDKTKTLDIATLETTLVEPKAE